LQHIICSKVHRAQVHILNLGQQSEIQRLLQFSQFPLPAGMSSLPLHPCLTDTRPVSSAHPMTGSVDLGGGIGLAGCSSASYQLCCLHHMPGLRLQGLELQARAISFTPKGLRRGLNPEPVCPPQPKAAASISKGQGGRCLLRLPRRADACTQDAATTYQGCRLSRIHGLSCVCAVPSHCRSDKQYYR
jgi:hypothetical protein